MRKIGLLILAVVAINATAYGQMDDRPYNLTVVAAATNSTAYVLRGVLEAVHIDVTAPATSTVTVATDDGRTLFTKASIAADAVYLPLAAVHKTDGNAATFVGGTNDTANAWYSKQPMAGSVTVTLVGQNIAGVTNNTIVTLIYAK